MGSIVAVNTDQAEVISAFHAAVLLARSAFHKSQVLESVKKSGAGKVMSVEKDDPTSAEGASQCHCETTINDV